MGSVRCVMRVAVLFPFLLSVQAGIALITKGRGGGVGSGREGGGVGSVSCVMRVDVQFPFLSSVQTRIILITKGQGGGEGGWWGRG